MYADVIFLLWYHVDASLLSPRVEHYHWQNTVFPCNEADFDEKRSSCLIF